MSVLLTYPRGTSNITLHRIDSNIYSLIKRWRQVTLSSGPLMLLPNTTFLNTRDPFIWNTERFKGLNLILNSTRVVLQAFSYPGTTYSAIFDPVILNIHIHTHTSLWVTKNWKQRIKKIWTMFHDKNHLCGQFCTEVSLCHLSLTGATMGSL